MNRRIKFRAWDTDYLVMKYNVGIDTEGDAFWNERCTTISVPNAMQYIGIKDSNNREIYEGDVLYNDLTDIKYLVTDIRYLPHQWTTDSDRLLGFKIIGNLYENKELLTEERK